MKPVHIFEGNNGNDLPTKETFEKAKIKFQPGIVTYERDAAALLNKQYKNVSMRELLSPGINLSKKYSHKICHYIDGNVNLRPVIISRTASTLEKDVNASPHTHHANCNITKPDYVINFLPAIATIKNFRLSTVKAPSKNSIDDKR